MLFRSQERYAQWERLGAEILEKLSAAVAAGADPAGPEGEEITELHRRWLTVMGDKHDAQRHRGIAELYVLDERFTAYYDRERPGCARFLRDAVLHWAKYGQGTQAEACVPYVFPSACR